MKEHNTSTIAKEFNIHPNTVRFYEKIGFLPQIPRKENRYRSNKRFIRNKNNSE